jgi:hypothetical protein
MTGWDGILAGTDPGWRRSARHFILKCRLNRQHGRERFKEWIDQVGSRDLDALVFAFYYWGETDFMDRVTLKELVDDPLVVYDSPADGER